MQQHPDDYAPFTEDDETFDKYLSRIRKVRACVTWSKADVLWVLGHQGLGMGAT